MRTYIYICGTQLRDSGFENPVRSHNTNQVLGPLPSISLNREQSVAGAIVVQLVKNNTVQQLLREMEEMLDFETLNKA